MWTGRFQQETDALVRAYGESISFDRRLYAHDIEGSVAHAAALAAAGLISEEERVRIETGLREIGGEIARGEFAFKTELEDIHMNIEAALTARVGPAGAKLHTARSRNDQVALDLRLYLRAEIAEVRRALRGLQRALVELGARHPEAAMPGYTHLQRAQPVLFAHHLLAYVEMFDRDAGRLADAARRLDVLPLGSGAIAGSTVVLDRRLVAAKLGFSAVSENSMDAVSDRDFACEFLAAAALVGMHLSRLSEDVILWATSEFHFVTLSDAFTTGSSLMPQKKNPDVAELTRGKTGRLYGNLFRLLTILKGLPMTYNRDLQEDKEAVFDSVDTLKAALAVFAGMLAEARVEEADMARATADPLLLATDLADYLVLKGVPFRQAHEVIGKLVALTLERKTGFAQLALEDYRAASPAFDADVFAVLDVRRSLESRRAPGAPSFENVRARLAHWQGVLQGATMKKSPLVADKEGWRTVRQESKYKDPFVEVTLDEVFTPTRQDKPAKWTVVHCKAAVMVVPMTPAGEVILVRQERIPARLQQWEFPAGQVDEGDSGDEATLRAAAVRELQEETGYALAGDGEMVNLGVSFTSPGFTDEHCHMYLARGVVPTETGTAYDEDEGITDCRAFGWGEFRRMIAEGEINDAHTLCAYARMHARGLTPG